MTHVVERAATFAQPLYLVGGSVRDALLPHIAETGRPPSRDLDLLSEGDAQTLGHALQEVFGGELSCHAEFMTCTLNLPDLTVDIATTREEVYPSPGSLPRVTKSTLDKDLFRRDFTLNALAVRLAPEPVVLIDLFGGLADLSHGQLRTLHPASFSDDPTRILRGARLAGRLGFTFHPETAAELKAALAAGAAETVSASRLKNELLLTLAEPQVAPALDLMARYGLLEAMFGFKVNAALLEQLTRLDEQRRTGHVPDESCLLLLLTSVPDNRLAEHVERLGWPKRFVAGRRVLMEAQQGGLKEGLKVDYLEQSAPVKAALKALSPELRAQFERLEELSNRRRLRGQDVLALGLPPGPAVGKVLAEIASARADGRLDSFQAELGLAKTLVEQHRAALDTPQETS